MTTARLDHRSRPVGLRAPLVWTACRYCYADVKAPQGAIVTCDRCVQRIITTTGERTNAQGTR